MNRQQRLLAAYEYLKSKGILHTQRQLAEILNTSETNISRAFNGGEGAITNGFFKRLNSAFDNIFSEDWLLYEAGEMLVQEKEKEKPSNHKTLPLLPIYALAGLPTDDINAIELKDCEEYDVPEFRVNGAQFLVRISGDSMLPQFSNGDIIACRPVPEITFFQWGKIYLLDTNQGPVIKQVYPDDANPDNIICHSLNTTLYPDFSIPKEDIRRLYTIIGTIKFQ